MQHSRYSSSNQISSVYCNLTEIADLVWYVFPGPLPLNTPNTLARSSSVLSHMGIWPFSCINMCSLLPYSAMCSTSLQWLTRPISLPGPILPYSCEMPLTCDFFEVIFLCLYVISTAFEIPFHGLTMPFLSLICWEV